MANADLIFGHKKIDAPNKVPVWDVDPYCETFLNDPYPHYAKLRDLGPIAFVPKYNILACGQYEITRDIFSDHNRFSSVRGVGIGDITLEDPWRPKSLILEADPPEHTRVRRVLMRAMSPKAVRELREWLDKAADTLVRTLVAQGSFDGISELAEPFPTQIFPQAIGLRKPDAQRLMAYGAMVFNSVGPDTPWRQASLATAATTVPWIFENCAREAMTNDGMAATVFAAADAGEITAEEAVLLTRSFLSAGVDTTITGIGNALWCLSQNPDALAMLQADPEKAALPVFEETLRFTSPVQGFYRTVAKDTDIAGHKIEEGAKILCCLAAANRDPEKWDNPDAFDATRRMTGHLALGAGIHSCVGQNIARAEAQAVLKAIGTHVATLKLKGEPVLRLNNAMRAFSSLEMKVTGR